MGEGTLTSSSEAPKERDRDGYATLIGQVAAGDPSALSALYNATSRLVFGLTLRVLANPADAEEVTLDVYTQAWRQASRYDAQRGDPLTWLLTLAHSRAIDRLRSRASARKREQPLDQVLEFPSQGPDPEATSALSQRSRLVRQALSQLPADQRTAIELAYFEGLTHVEIAERIQEPLGTAKSRIRLGMVKLREALATTGEGWAM